MSRMAAVVVLLAACAAEPGSTGRPPELGTTPGQWEFVSVPGTQCMNGTPTGIGVNLGTSGDLVIYMEGGGACFNNSTCDKVAHESGWGPNNFGADITPYNIGMFDRLDDANQFREATFVFIPYCTGDVHAGTKPDGLGGRKFVGYTNVGHDLDYLVPKSTGVTRVILSGSSAGGFGALMNYERTQAAFGATPVHLLDDSAPPLGDAYLSPCLQRLFRTTWNLDAILPAGCTECRQADGGGLQNMLGYLADTHPDRRFGIVTSTRDGTIRSFYGYGYPTCTGGESSFPMPEEAYAEGITHMRDDFLANHPNFRMFTKDSGEHVWLLFNPATVRTRKDGGTRLSQWLADMLDPDATWQSVAP